MSGGIEQRSPGAGDTKQSSTVGAKRDQRSVLVIGSGDLTEETAQALEASGARVAWLREPGEGDVREALKRGSIDSVAVVAGEDPLVLRMALMVRAVSEDVSMLLSIFDPTMASEMENELPNAQVTSLADIVAPSLAGPCIDERFTAVSVVDGGRPRGLAEAGDDVREEPIPRRRPRRLEAFLRALFTRTTREKEGVALAELPRGLHRAPVRFAHF